MTERSTEPYALAAEIAALGVVDEIPAGTAERIVEACAHHDAVVRRAALGALARRADRVPEPAGPWRAGLADPDATVRRRAALAAPALAASGRVDPTPDLVAALVDDEVAEAAAWALGELGGAATAAGAVPRLAALATDHRDPLVRESAVATLGALGDVAGLDAILVACGDKPAIRRRAVLALAAFEGPEVDAALAAAREDRDRQTRQAAEDLLRSAASP